MIFAAMVCCTKSDKNRFAFGRLLTSRRTFFLFGKRENEKTEVKMHKKLIFYSTAAIFIWFI
jgi:hypothetical protein